MTMYGMQEYNMYTYGICCVFDETCACLYVCIHNVCIHYDTIFIFVLWGMCVFCRLFVYTMCVVNASCNDCVLVCKCVPHVHTCDVICMCAQELVVQVDTEILGVFDVNKFAYVHIYWAGHLVGSFLPPW